MSKDRKKVRELRPRALQHLEVGKMKKTNKAHRKLVVSDAGRKPRENGRKVF